MAETLKRVFWKPELVASLKTFVENEDGGKFAKHVKDPLSDKPWTYFKSHWAKCFEAWKSTNQADTTTKRINVQSFKRKYKACCVNPTKEKARGKAEGIKTKNMQDMLNLARHRKQSFKTGGGRAVTPPPTPYGSDLDDEDLERLPVVAADIEGADFSLPPDEVFKGSSSPVVSYRKNPNEPNQLTFIIENEGSSAGVDEGVNDEMIGSLMDEEEGGQRKKKERENGRKSAGVDEVRVHDGMDGSLMDEEEGGQRKKKERVNSISDLGRKKAKQISTNMLIKLAAEKDGNSSIRKELLLIDRQIKIEQLNTVKDQRKFQAEYNAEKLRHLKEMNKKRMEMLEERRIRTHDDTLHFTPGSSF